MKLTLAKDLDALRAAGLSRLDRGMRGRRATNVNADVHAAKLAEARAVAFAVRLDAIAPSAPLLAAEAKTRSMMVGDLALEVIARHETAAGELAGLEARRQAAQQAIRSAASPAAIEAAISRALGGDA